MLICLNTYASPKYQHDTGLTFGVSQSSVHRCIKRVTKAILTFKAQVIKMPTIQQLQSTAQNMENRYRLPNFGWAIDGCHVLFEEKPRDLPNGVNPQDFWCRKQNYSINTQIIGNDQGLILDMDHRWAGRKHDARVWRRSEAKRYIENQPIEARFYLAADSAYPISPFLMKPFKVNEAAGDPLKRLFNRRLSGLRTLMSECIYGRWKRRFPVIKHIRNHTPLARDIILATAILHNLSIYWNEELPDDGDDNRDPVVVQPVLGPIQEEALAVRAAGQQLRERIMLNMPV